jgi:RHS repeat-associated protein
MAVYERSYQALSQFNLYKESVRLIEQHIYGSDRIGLRKCNVLVYEDVFSISAIDSNTHEFIGKAKPVLSGGDGTGNGGRGPVASPAVHVIVGSGNHLAEQYQRTLGDKRYELQNHLGNILTVITDRKIAVDNVSYVSGNGTYISAPSNNQLYLQVTTGTFIQLSNPDLKVDYYTAEIVKSTEYSCYGVELVGWGYVSVDSYRFGYNGMESCSEVNAYLTDFRMLDARIGRWWSIDPLSAQAAFLSPYNAMNNSPLSLIDPSGLKAGGPYENIEEELSQGLSWNDPSEMYNQLYTQWASVRAINLGSNDGAAKTVFTFGTKLSGYYPHIANDGSANPSTAAEGSKVFTRYVIIEVTMGLDQIETITYKIYHTSGTATADPWLSDGAYFFQVVNEGIMEEDIGEAIWVKDNGEYYFDLGKYGHLGIDKFDSDLLQNVMNYQNETGMLYALTLAEDEAEKVSVAKDFVGLVPVGNYVEKLVGKVGSFILEKVNDEALKRLTDRQRLAVNGFTLYYFSDQYYMDKDSEDPDGMALKKGHIQSFKEISLTPR